MEKTKGFYPKFCVFFLPDMVKTTAKKVFTENLMLLFLSFLILGEDFPIFVVSFFTETCCAWGSISKGDSREQEKKIE